MRYKLAVLTALLGTPLLGDTVPMTYTDVGAWAIAATSIPNITLEGATISNGQIQAPDLTITTNSGMDGIYGPGNGQLINNLWADCVGTNACNGNLYDTTTFTFDKPTYAFGANFNVQGGTSAGLELYTNGPDWVSPNQAPGDLGPQAVDFDGFFGLVSQQPFTSIVFASSYGSESFTLSDLTYAVDPPTAVPEPAALVITGLACLALASFRKKRLDR